MPESNFEQFRDSHESRQRLEGAAQRRLWSEFGKWFALSAVVGTLTGLGAAIAGIVVEGNSASFWWRLLGGFAGVFVLGLMNTLQLQRFKRQQAIDGPLGTDLTFGLMLGAIGSSIFATTGLINWRGFELRIFLAALCVGLTVAFLTSLVVNRIAKKEQPPPGADKSS